jgi:hypothetical protein
MNCREFESIVVDIVRGEAGSSREAAAGQAHAASCARCTALLSEQQELTLRLEALASQSEEAGAPERMESALRLEFRNRNAVADCQIARQHYGSNPTWVSEIFSHRLAWAVAAVVVIATVGVVMAERFGVKPAVTSPADGPSRAQMHPAATPAIPLSPRRGEEPIHSSAPRARCQTNLARRSLEPFNNHPVAHRIAARKRGRGRAPAPSQNTGDEAATPFYPLPYGSGLDLDEGWQMVRVNLPVSALTSLGVPLAGELSSAQFVKADVVLGEDGTARAIRFVQ